MCANSDNNISCTGVSLVDSFRVEQQAVVDKEVMIDALTSDIEISRNNLSLFICEYKK